MNKASGTKDIVEMQEVIKELLNRHTYLTEKRIQKLIFLADLHSIQTRRKRLVNADYKRYFYGVYSDLLGLALQRITGVKVSLQTTPEGAEVLVFLKPDKQFKTHLSKDDLKIIEETLEAYSQYTTEELAEIGKHTLLWESAEHGEKFDYRAYMQDDASFMSPAMMRAYENALKAERSGKVRAANSVDELMLGIE